MNNNTFQDNDFLWNKLKGHYGYNVCIAFYGDADNPDNTYDISSRKGR